MYIVYLWWLLGILRSVATQVLIFLQLYLLESKTIYAQLMYKCCKKLLPEFEI